MERNAIIGQCGAPSAAANASLAGVLQTCQKRGCEHVYGMRYGIEGLIEGKYIDLGEECGSAMEIELLKRTPASYLGSCMSALPAMIEDPQVYDRLFRVLERLDVVYFFYIGGADAMDAVMKLADYGRSINSAIRFVGVPNACENDIPGMDHTPGYGSAAKYTATVMKEICRDAAAHGDKRVTIVETMGRETGWLAASAALARGEDCEGVDLICLPEVPFYPERFVQKIESLIRDHPSIVVALAEGVKLPDGRSVAAFGSEDGEQDAGAALGAAQVMCNYVGRTLKIRAQAVVLSALQRCSAHIASGNDIAEAYQAGGAAAAAALDGYTGVMAALKRISDDPYQCVTEMADIHLCTGDKRTIGAEWINNYRNGVTTGFNDYARPLTQGELPPVYVDGLPRHIYMKE